MGKKCNGFRKRIAGGEAIIGTFMKTPSPVVAEVLGLSELDVIAIVASTGGPPALQTILAGLPAHFPVPILVVQHLAEGFERSRVFGSPERSERSIEGVPVLVSGLRCARRVPTSCTSGAPSRRVRSGIPSPGACTGPASAW